MATYKSLGKELKEVPRVFTTLKKYADVSFPADRPCEVLFKVTHLADGRLASLYGSNSRNENRADTLTLHDLASPEVSQMMFDQGIYPAVDVAVTAKDELMLLRSAKPCIRIYNCDLRHVHSINISLGMDDISNLRSIECDKEGNIFLAGIDDHLRVFNPSGIMIQDVKVGMPFWPKMSYCGTTKTLCISSQNKKVLRFHWDGTTLKQSSSFTVGSARDMICIGHDQGVLFVAGFMEGMREIGIYQLAEEVDNNTSGINVKELDGGGPGSGMGSHRSEFKKLNFEDNLRRMAVCYPNISISGKTDPHTLALACGDKLEMFHLCQ